MSMSTVWMRMPGQTWPAAAASFLGMWVGMMVVMMMPSLALILWRERLGRHTAVVGVAYFFVWAVIGIAIYPGGVALAAIQTPYSPLARGVALFVAAAMQFTVCQRPEKSGAAPLDSGSAWRYGLRLGLDCAWCCAGFMTMLLVIGITNLGAMAIVTVAITVQRLAGRRPDRRIPGPAGQ
jgi:predicted metal-binding membrane protein